MKYINKVCGVCHNDVKHEIKETGIVGFRDYKMVKCTYCGFNEMVPDDKIHEETFVEVENEGTFDINNRDVGSDCEDGLCPVK